VTGFIVGAGLGWVLLAGVSWLLIYVFVGRPGPNVQTPLPLVFLLIIGMFGGVVGGGILGFGLVVSGPAGAAKALGWVARKVAPILAVAAFLGTICLIALLLEQPREIHAYVVNGRSETIAVLSDGAELARLEPDEWVVVKCQKAQTSLAIRPLEDDAPSSAFEIPAPGIYVLNVGPNYRVRYGPISYVARPDGVVSAVLGSDSLPSMSFHGKMELDGEGLLVLENVPSGIIDFDQRRKHYVLDFDTPVPKQITSRDSTEVLFKLTKERK
jgi:hypothetical protein